jgi:bifunctional DNase/RNase
MKKNGLTYKSENNFYFFDAFYTYYSFFAIFINDNKTRFFTSLLDVLKFTTIVNVSQNKMGIESCGIYSYVIDLVNKMNLSIDCVNLMFSEKAQAPLTNLVIRNKKNQKIDDVSKIFLFPADGSLISVLLKVPISIDDNSLKHLTLPVVQNIELPLLVDLVKRSIMLVEEKENKK